MSIFYEYSSVDGFLIGWYDEPFARPFSTAVDYAPIPAIRAKWDGFGWVNDPTRENAVLAQEALEPLYDLRRADFTRTIMPAYPFTNALGRLANDGIGGLTWNEPSYYARIMNPTQLSLAAAGPLVLDRVTRITNAASATYTLPVAPATGAVVAVGTADFSTVGAAQATLDAGVGVKVCGRTRFLVLTHSNSALLRWNGTEWSALALDLDSPWVDGGVITIGATTLAPVKGTTTRDKFWWSRSGQDLLVRYEYRQTAVGAATNGTGDYLFTLPFSADTALAHATTALNNYDMFASTLGAARYVRGSESVVGAASLYDATRFRISGIHLDSPVSQSDNDPVNSGIGLNNANVAFSASIRVPVLNW